MIFKVKGFEKKQATYCKYELLLLILQTQIGVQVLCRQSANTIIQSVILANS